MHAVLKRACDMINRLDMITGMRVATGERNGALACCFEKILKCGSILIKRLF